MDSTAISMTFETYCARVIASQRSDVRALFDEATSFAAGNLSVTGSGLRNFVAWMEVHRHASAIRAIFDSGLDDAVRVLNAIDDHAEAIELLMRNQRGHSPAVATLLRGLTEGVVTLCYLYDASVPPPQLAARHVAYRVDAAQGNEKTLSTFGTEASAADRERARSGTDGVKAFFLKHGFELGTTKNSTRFTPWVSLDGEVAQVKIIVTDAVAKYMPDDTFGWSIASGAVHSKAWFLPSFVSSVEEEALGEPDQSVTAIVDSVLSASDALVECIGAHTGYDVSATIKRTFTRRKAVLAAHLGTGFSPIDLETYNSRGKSRAPATPGRVGPSFVRPGTTYGSKSP